MENVMKINDLTIMVSTIDKFALFSENARKLMASSKNANQALMNLYNISKGQKVFGARNIKKFYEKNKEVVDTINKYSDINLFLSKYYATSGKIKDENLLNYHEYVISHQEHKEEMLKLLESLREKGIENIIVDEKADFSFVGYSLCKNFQFNTSFAYLDNMEATPSYDDNILWYETNKSDYKMNITPKYSEADSNYCQVIEVNNLWFDPERLPKSLSKKDTFDEIISLREKKEDEYKVIKDAVELRLGVNDLYEQYNKLMSIADGLTTGGNNKGIIYALQKINNDLTQLQIAEKGYERQQRSYNPKVNRQVIDDEVKTYIKRKTN